MRDPNIFYENVLEKTYFISRQNEVKDFSTLRLLVIEMHSSNFVNLKTMMEIPFFGISLSSLTFLTYQHLVPLNKFVYIVFSYLVSRLSVMISTYQL